MLLVQCSSVFSYFIQAVFYFLHFFVIENNDIFQKKTLLVFWALVFLSDILFLHFLKITVLNSSLNSKSKLNLSMFYWYFLTTLNLHWHYTLNLTFKCSIKIDLCRDTIAIERISCNNNRIKHTVQDSKFVLSAFISSALEFVKQKKQLWLSASKQQLLITVKSVIFIQSCSSYDHKDFSCQFLS